MQFVQLLVFTQMPGETGKDYRSGRVSLLLLSRGRDGLLVSEKCVGICM